MASKSKESPLDIAMVWLANFLEQMGRTDNALSLYNSMLKRNPKFIPALYGRCMVSLSKLEDDKAAADAQKAVAAAPRDPVALRMRGIVELMTGKYEEAEADFKKALELNEGDPMSNLFVYFMLCKEGIPDKAVDFLRGVLESKIQTEDWPAPVLKFWRGTASMADLMAISSTNNAKLLECRAYLGFAKALSKYPVEGKSDLQFVYTANAGSALVKTLASRGLKLVQADQADNFEAKRKKADKTAGMDWLD